MTAYPNTYNKKTFINFLENNNVSDIIINKFKNLPETLTKNDNEYTLSINTIWDDDGKTKYNFEINYYSEEKIEFLFPYKIFTDPEKSIDFLFKMIVKL
ncbi:MAG: hypothetical protein ACOC33_03585 [bacterium]